MAAAAILDFSKVKSEGKIVWTFLLGLVRVSNTSANMFSIVTEL